MIKAPNKGYAARGYTQEQIDYYRAYHRQWYQDNKEKAKASVMARRKGFQAKGLCGDCGKIETGGKRCDTCAQSDIKRDLQYKIDAFNAYGGCICRCCGMEGVIFLSIDHVNNDGAEHRKEVGSRMYKWLRTNKYPTGFQVLCHNCNQAKHINGGICPHQQIHGYTISYAL